MQIIFVCHRIPYPPNKGDKIRSFAELKALSAKHEVDVFCLYDDPEDAKYIPELEKYCRRLNAQYVPKWQSRLQTIVSLLKGEPLSVGHFRSGKLRQQVQKALATKNYDVAVGYSSSIAQYLQQESVPRLIDIVDVDSNKWRQYSERFRGLRRFVYQLECSRMRRYEEAAVQEFDKVYVSTNRERRLLDPTRSEEKIKVLEQPLDIAHVRAWDGEIPKMIASHQPYFVFCGQMDYLPNVDAAELFCREIWPSVKEKYPDTRFVIAGRNPAKAVIRLAEEGSVIVTGAVPDMRPYLAGALAAVVPMRIACGIQTKILEALALGVPVIATANTVEAIPEALRPMLKIAGDRAAFVEHLLELCGKRDLPDREATARIVAEYYQRLGMFEELLADAERLGAKRLDQISEGSLVGGPR